ncbi:MAG: hypothetical protein C0609_02080 [Deltaproteobacteria bacterium]|mgnify:CR=1 FL=1|nr:MAG: hypothetical protein C0609_02080 [Deltaproteobacteria bacterium]
MRKILEKILITLLLSLTIFLSACSTGPVVLEPGPINLVAPEDEGADKWSLWIESVKDSREAPAPNWFGELDNRFSDEISLVSMKPAPADYYREHLSRMLLSMGVEASSRAAAKVYLDVDILKFRAYRDTSAAMDFLTVELDSKVKFTRAGGKVLGTTTIPVVRTLKIPVGRAESIENLVRKAVIDTLDGLKESEIFKEAIGKK